MGEIVMTAEAGARFGFSLVWVVLLGTVGIIIYAEMAGRIATLTQRAVFDVVRERVGARFGLLNLLATLVINLVTLVAEIAGIAIAFQLVTQLSYMLWVPLAALLVFIIIWMVSFEKIEKTFGIVGLAMVVFGFAFFKMHPDVIGVLGQVFEPDVPKGEAIPSYWYFAVALFGAAMTPYEVAFYSSGAVEERWDRSDLIVNRGTAFIGFTVGGLLATFSIGVAALVFHPHGVSVEELSQVALGPASALGTIGLVAVIVGLFASTTGAALEVTLATGYSLAQYFGWPWGKMMRPRVAARFHLSMIVVLILAALTALTSVDPIKVTEVAVIFSALGLPLTYFPVLIVANDRQYMGDRVNGRALNVVASIYLVIVALASISAIPLLIITRMGS